MPPLETTTRISKQQSHFCFSESNFKSNLFIHRISLTESGVFTIKTINVEIQQRRVPRSGNTLCEGHVKRTSKVLTMWPSSPVVKCCPNVVYMAKDMVSRAAHYFSKTGFI